MSEYFEENCGWDGYDRYCDAIARLAMQEYAAHKERERQEKEQGDRKDT